MKPVLVLLTLWLSVAPLVPAADPAAPASSKEAVELFQRLWKESLETELKESSHLPQLRKQAFEAGRVGAQRMTAEKAWRRVTMTLSPAEQKTLIVYGKLTDAKKDGAVWVVINPGDIGNGFEAFLDAATGKLLFLWIVPEG
jgi:hypothetical protein